MKIIIDIIKEFLQSIFFVGVIFIAIFIFYTTEEYFGGYGSALASMGIIVVAGILYVFFPFGYKKD